MDYKKEEILNIMCKGWFILKVAEKYKIDEYSDSNGSAKNRF